MKETFFMIYLQPEEQLSLKYILKNWVMGVISNPNCHQLFASQMMDTYLDLAKDLDGIEADSFVLPMMRTAIFRSALDSFYHKNTIPLAQAEIGSKHYEMLAKWFFEDKVSMTKDDILNLGSGFNIL